MSGPVRHRPRTKPRRLPRGTGRVTLRTRTKQDIDATDEAILRWERMLHHSPVLWEVDQDAEAHTIQDSRSCKPGVRGPGMCCSCPLAAGAYILVRYKRGKGGESIGPLCEECRKACHLLGELNRALRVYDAATDEDTRAPQRLILDAVLSRFPQHHPPVALGPRTRVARPSLP